MEVNRVKKRRTSIEMLQFDVKDYVQNPVMIKKLNEEKELALAETDGLKHELDKLISCNHILEVQKRELEIKLDVARKGLADKDFKILIQVIVSLVATIMIGIGINIVTSTLSETRVVTSTSYTWVGWLMIALGMVLNVAGFFIAFSRRERRENNG
jgi:hypothetical protein